MRLPAPSCRASTTPAVPPTGAPCPTSPTIPSGTTLALSVRRGDTPTPDGSWSPFSPIANGEVVGGSSRYVQYRVEATSSTGDVTPTLSSVTLPYSASVGHRSARHHRAHAGAGCHRRRRRHERHRDLRRAHRPGDGHHLDRHASRPGRGQRRPGDGHLHRRDRDARSDRRSGAQHPVHGHGRRDRRGRSRQRARGGRHLDVHDCGRTDLRVPVFHLGGVRDPWLSPR